MILNDFKIKISEARRIKKIKKRITKQEYNIIKGEDILKYIKLKRTLKGLKIS
jgi:hypothetical protein